MPAPKRARLYAFNVGFGDCLLLRFEYDDRNRHVLIDFGTTRRPPGAKQDFEIGIAEKIAELCGAGGLDVLVATHRHRDHVSGFATKPDGTGSGDIIAALEPKLVLQPWTENPDAPRGGGIRSFRAQLDHMSDVAAAALRFADARFKEADAGAGAQLAFLGEDNIQNKSAVENLIAMGEAARHGAHYLKFGDAVEKLGAALPGVKLHVLGPPSPDQWPQVRRQAANVEGEYWLNRSLTAKRTCETGLATPLFETKPVPAYALWIAERAREAQAESLHTIVRALDSAMNNTSLILLFEAGGKKLLFPGDAQWENWSYVLDQTKTQPEIASLLEGVDLYKVGHHGSRNATPKTLWKTFKKSGPKSKRGRLKSVMSTLHGVHGETRATAVPRSSLVRALKELTNHQTTEDATKPVICDLDLA